MCGFVCIVSRKDEPIDCVELKKTTDTLSHRGPNDRAFFVDANVGLGFRRLSILDLSKNGRQPMCDEEESLFIVFNGEIYNYIELRNELESFGYRFKSSCDTEVLLYAFKQWGAGCLDRFNGMWAFLIYDKNSEKIFGARDRFGIKPLFFHQSDGRTIFASEIKAIRSWSKYTSKVNWPIATEYLLKDKLSESSSRMETFFSGINEIPAGWAFELCTSSGFRQWQYWGNEQNTRDNAESDPVTEFVSLFEDSVKLRMRSDVPVGVCLSGGLDSTSIICRMARLLDKKSHSPIRAFSFMSEQFDESKQIADTIRQTGAELHRLQIDPMALWAKLDEVLYFHDEPVHSLNVLISYELYRLASENGVKVILNGQGADELLAGYPSYFYNYWYSLFWSGQLLTFLQEIKSYVAAHHIDAVTLQRKILSLILKSPLRKSSAYRKLSSWQERKKLAEDRWYTKDLLDSCPRDHSMYESQHLNDTLCRSVTQSPLPLYLRVEDRNSMAHSVEARLPFLDYRLAKMTSSLPDKLKMCGPWNKFILRDSMNGRIPDSVRLRKDKMGFPVPNRDWFSGPLYESVRDMVSSQFMRERGIYNTRNIIEDFDKHHCGQIDVSHKIFRVVQFERICQSLTK
jgi:asparagine synthase (glutamine-hydrolysing)